MLQTFTRTVHAPISTITYYTSGSYVADMHHSTDVTSDTLVASTWKGRTGLSVSTITVRLPRESDVLSVYSVDFQAFSSYPKAAFSPPKGGLNDWHPHKNFCCFHLLCSAFGVIFFVFLLVTSIQSSSLGAPRSIDLHFARNTLSYSPVQTHETPAMQAFWISGTLLHYLSLAVRSSQCCWSNLGN